MHNPASQSSEVLVRGNGNGARPSISVVLPLFNQERFVVEAVTSVLAQGYPDLELIIVDDGSSDGSVLALGHLADRVTIMTQGNKGPAAARNAGLSRARGNLISFIDADDCWPVNRFRGPLESLLSDPDADVALGRIRLLEAVGAGDSTFALSNRSFHGVQLGSGLFRRRVFEKVGPFDETLRYSEDHDWFFRARENRIKIVPVETDALYYRVHAGSMTRMASRAPGFDLPRVIKRSLERRRSQSSGCIRSLDSLAIQPSGRSDS